MSLTLEMSSKELVVVVENLADAMLQEGCLVTSRPLLGLHVSMAYSIALEAPAQSFTMTLLIHERSASVLVGHMTGKKSEELSAKAIDDGMMEWLNILAGQVKSVCGLDHRMGLPQKEAYKPFDDAVSCLGFVLPQLSIELSVGFSGAQLKHESKGETL